MAANALSSSIAAIVPWVDVRIFDAIKRNSLFVLIIAFSVVWPDDGVAHQRDFTAVTLLNDTLINTLSCERSRAIFGEPFMERKSYQESVFLYIKRQATYQKVLFTQKLGQQTRIIEEIVDLGGQSAQLVLWFDSSCLLRDFLSFREILKERRQ